MTTVSNENVPCKKTMEIDVNNPYASSVSKLSRGLISLYSTPMVNVEKQLKELTSKQEFLVTQIHDENLRLSEVQYSPEIQETFIKLKAYHSKLLNLKKDMKLIYEKSSKLKKRALRLQQVREKGLNKTQNENKFEPGSSGISNN